MKLTDLNRDVLMLILLLLEEGDLRGMRLVNKHFNEVYFRCERIFLTKTLEEGCIYKISGHLFRAIKEGKTETVGYIFSQIKSVEKKHALAFAKCENTYEEEGREVHPEYATPLYVAAKHGLEDIVKVLISNKAWGNIVPYMPNPFRIAVINQHSTVFIKMYENSGEQFGRETMRFIECLQLTSEITNLFLAAKNGDVETAKFLIQNGHRIDFKENRGRTPLFEAARKGRVEVVSTLLQAGADINCQDNFGVTPLCVAARNGHLDVVKILLKNGADIALRTNRGFTPLNAANEFGHTEVAKEILKQIAKNVHEQNLKAYLQYIEKDPKKKNQYDAGKAFLQFFKKGTPIPEQHTHELSSGVLGEYVCKLS